MPQIGEIKKGREIGKVRDKIECSTNFIWCACIICGKERWVRFRNGKPTNLRCRSHPMHWGGGRFVESGGYIRIKFPPNDFFYPMADHRGYVLEHRLVMAKHLGRCLQPWEIVHHKGTRYPRCSIEDKQDNRLENLELSTRGGHASEHNKGYHDGYQKGFADGQSSQVKELRKEIKFIQFQNSQLLEELRKYDFIEG